MPMLPEARFVYIVRNPYAVAASWKRRAENEADAAWPVENDDRAAVPVWNESLRCALDALAKVGAERMAVLGRNPPVLFTKAMIRRSPMSRA